MNTIDLKDQVAVVTGGGRGIGFAIAQRLVESGARVSLWDIEAALVADAKVRLGGGTSGIVVDITSYTAVAAAAAAVRRRMAESISW